ncbi:Ank2, partial [Symbiodinium microadriaticum]
MLNIWQASGNKLTSFPVEELANVFDVKHLKRRLSKVCGASRFRQRLLQDGTILQDSACLIQPIEPQDLHLVLLPFCRSSDSDKERVNAAIRRRDADYVESVLQGPHDPEALTTPLSSPMVVASYYRCLEIAKLLLEARAHADRAVQDETPLFVAASKGSLGIVQLLLAAGADKDRTCRGMTPLFAAVTGTSSIERGIDCQSVAGLLLEARAGCDTVSCFGGHLATPLYYAVASEQTALVPLLLRGRADPNHVCARGNTPLHVASEKGLAITVNQLLAARAGVEFVRATGHTALHLACSRGYDEIVQKLLESCADRDQASSHDGMTPLHLASAPGHASAVSLLLQARADKDKACISDDTPLDLARAAGHAEIVQLL